MNAGYSVRALAAARNKLIGGNLSKVLLILSTSGSRGKGVVFHGYLLDLICRDCSQEPPRERHKAQASWKLM